MATTFNVQVPDGVKPGMALQLTAPNGVQVQVQVRVTHDNAVSSREPLRRMLGTLLMTLRATVELLGLTSIPPFSLTLPGAGRRSAWQRLRRRNARRACCRNGHGRRTSHCAWTNWRWRLGLWFLRRRLRPGCLGWSRSEQRCDAQRCT